MSDAYDIDQSLATVKATLRRLAKQEAHRRYYHKHKAQIMARQAKRRAKMKDKTNTKRRKRYAQDADYRRKCIESAKATRAKRIENDPTYKARRAEQDKKYLAKKRAQHVANQLLREKTMTDIDTTTAPVKRRPRQILPDPFTKMGAVAQQLWRAAQDSARPDAPFIGCGELAEILGATTESTSANLAQLRHRGLVAQIRKPRRSGRGTIALYGLTDAGAVACAAAFGG